jgi:glutamate synthase (ferredoxin)
MYFVAQELREIMAQLGFRTIDEMVGQVHKLDRNETIEQYKIRGVDLSPILHQVQVAEDVALHNTEKQDHHLEKSLDFEIIKKAHPALFRKEKTILDFNITNEDRSVGAILSNEISKIYGVNGLPENTLKLNFNGSAGQSFGAFSAHGITLSVTGNTNDYIGKGLSGAKLIVKVPDDATIKPEENVIIGNVALYGATAGEVYINGKAGERFGVRNSGARAVVEGIGDHGCEYMTGGVVVVLGEVGRNFGAGMSGGIAYVYDRQNTLSRKANKEGLNLDPVVEDFDREELKSLIEAHYNATLSPIAQRLLENWEKELKYFIKVLPEEYKQALIRLEEENKVTA